MNDVKGNKQTNKHTHHTQASSRQLQHVLLLLQTTTAATAPGKSSILFSPPLLPSPLLSVICHSEQHVRKKVATRVVQTITAADQQYELTFEWHIKIFYFNRDEIGCAGNGRSESSVCVCVM